MIDLKRYRDLKSNGFLTLVRIEDSVVISQKKFDQNTGEPLQNEITQIDFDRLKERKIAIEEELSEINSFLDECEEALSQKDNAY